MVVSLYNRIFMSEAGFCFHNDPHPILSTDGLRSCIGFAGWEPNKKIGFLVHFFTPEQVVDFQNRGIQILSEMTEMDSSTFDCVTVGGCLKTSYSLKIVEAIRAIKLPSHLSFQVKEEPISKTFELKSLSLDTRTGDFGEYRVEEDPDPRELEEDEKQAYLGIDSLNKLSYRCINNL